MQSRLDAEFACKRLVGVTLQGFIDVINRPRIFAVGYLRLSNQLNENSVQSIKHTVQNLNGVSLVGG